MPDEIGLGGHTYSRRVGRALLRQQVYQLVLDRLLERGGGAGGVNERHALAPVRMGHGEASGQIGADALAQADQLRHLEVVEHERQLGGQLHQTWIFSKIINRFNFKIRF